MRADPPLVERGSQLAVLDDLLVQVRADRTGRMVFVGGEAGAGKSALLSEFGARVGVPAWLSDRDGGHRATQ